MKIVWGIIQKLILALLVCVIALNVAIVASRVFFNQDLPKLFGYSQAVVMSGSMSPELEVGDVVLYKLQDEYFVGDVIIFDAGGYFVTHRITEVVNGGFITQGDANNVADNWIVAFEDINGKAIAVLPNFGSVVDFVKTPLGIMLIVVAIFACIEVPKLIEARKKEKEADDEEKI